MQLSILAFLSAPLGDPSATLRELCRSALDQDATDITAGPAPATMRATCAAGEQRFALEYGDQPSDQAAAPPGHRAWLRCAWIERQPVPGFPELFGPLGRLAAAACGLRPVALYQPYWERSAPVTDDTPTELTSDQPLRPFGVVHTNLGCLVRDHDRWQSEFPTRWGPVEVELLGGASGPSIEAADRMRAIAEHQLRGYRARLLISLLYRPCRILCDGHGEISVEFRNWLTGSRAHFVAERDVAS